jgi:formate-dependent nitrite reductase membrane component NrfD/ferredoxin
MFRRADGIVDFDKSICIGCKACIAACPYDAIFINPEDHAAEKCNFCAHRLDIGLEPACVIVCPTEAILVGDLSDPTSHVAQIVHREAVAVRRPEKETRPKLFYKGAHQVTLDPLAARWPQGGLFMWSEQGDPNRAVPARNPHRPNSSAAALLCYDVPHRAPWDWHVSLYTWTKAIAAGAYLAPLGLIITGLLTWESALWTLAAPATAGIALAVTGALLLGDLERPSRFYLIFTRPQWESWLVRGAFAIVAYAVVLALHLLGGVAGRPAVPRALVVPGALLATATAGYTAYLFAQAKARDLWQNPLLPLHFVVLALLAGMAALVPVAQILEPDAVTALLRGTALGSAAHLLLISGELTLTHASAHVSLAVAEMTQGRYRHYFWIGMLLVGSGVLAPWLGMLAAVSALLGLLAYEHAYVQAGQAVPLA